MRNVVGPDLHLGQRLVVDGFALAHNAAGKIPVRIDPAHRDPALRA
ncbi:hypothetical protein ACIQYW_01170 [Rhodococcus erythropolis]|uniref:Uncharacterized protein n=1 Tax=Rhodococcus baikonurensis TaxID=172041 RepID=A0ABV5XGC7_9NOCA|nr:hypothetical protein [uncultured Rhodococcus sp.]